MADLLNSVQSFNPGSMFSFFDSGLISKVYFFGKVFFFAIGLAFAVLLFWKFYMQFNVRVTIKSRIGTGGLEVKEDMAKIVVDEQNKRKLQLFKSHKGKQPLTCPVPESRFKGKKGRLDHYEMWKDDNDQLHPIDHPEVLEHGGRLKIRPQERDAWARFEDKALLEKYRKQDLLTKWAPAAILMIAMITAFLIWFFAAKELGTGLSNLASQFAQIASSCTKLG